MQIRQRDQLDFILRWETSNRDCAKGVIQCKPLVVHSPNAFDSPILDVDTADDLPLLQIDDGDDCVRLSRDVSRWGKEDELRFLHPDRAREGDRISSVRRDLHIDMNGVYVFRIGRTPAWYVHHLAYRLISPPFSYSDQGPLAAGIRVEHQNTFIGSDPH